ncbi:MAG: hypothetical protein ACE14L_09145 [Terriglobales bacterium]
MNRNRRILLLHTDEQVLMDLERTLEDMGVETATTWDVAEALKLAQARHFDLLLVGDHPPEISASEVLRELQCARAATPCVVLQGGRQRFEPEYFYSLGASGVINTADPEAVAKWVKERFAVKAMGAVV